MTAELRKQATTVENKILQSSVKHGIVGTYCGMDNHWAKYGTLHFRWDRINDNNFQDFKAMGLIASELKDVVSEEYIIFSELDEDYIGIVLKLK